MYQLEIRKNAYVIEVKPLKAVFKNRNIPITNEIMKYNEVFYFCNKKQPLREKALEIKTEWTKETEEILNKIKSIEI